MNDLLEPRCRAAVPSVFDRAGAPARSMWPRIALQYGDIAKYFRNSVCGGVTHVNEDLSTGGVTKLCERDWVKEVIAIVRWLATETTGVDVAIYDGQIFRRFGSFHIR